MTYCHKIWMCQHNSKPDDTIEWLVQSIHLEDKFFKEHWALKHNIKHRCLVPTFVEQRCLGAFEPIAQAQDPNFAHWQYLCNQAKIGPQLDLEDG